MRLPFHLAFAVTDLSEASRFYHLLQCPIGRESDRRIDSDFHGHTAHLANTVSAAAALPVDWEPVPGRHFGAILDMPAWKHLAERPASEGVEFLIAPQIRFAGEIPGPHW